MSGDADVRRLLDLEEIRQLKARYCLLLDAQEWDELRRLFADDATANVSSGHHASADEFVAAVRSGLTGNLHVHFAQMPIIEIDGDRARGLWGFSNRGALGHYQEEYRREPDGWKIASIEQTWIVPPSEELLRLRTGAFHTAADRWRELAARWARPRA
jgi:hypothetical protein